MIVPDRRPPDSSPDALDHDRDYKRAVDLLLLAGKTVLVAKAPECQHPGGGACKDADEYLRRHGPIRLKELIETTEVSALSLDGEARKLALIDGPARARRADQGPGDRAEGARSAAAGSGDALPRGRKHRHRARR